MNEDKNVLHYAVTDLWFRLIGSAVKSSHYIEGLNYVTKDQFDKDLINQETNWMGIPDRIIFSKHNKFHSRVRKLNRPFSVKCRELALEWGELVKKTNYPHWPRGLSLKRDTFPARILISNYNGKFLKNGNCKVYIENIYFIWYDKGVNILPNRPLGGPKSLGFDDITITKKDDKISWNLRNNSYKSEWVLPYDACQPVMHKDIDKCLNETFIKINELQADRVFLSNEDRVVFYSNLNLSPLFP